MGVRDIIDAAFARPLDWQIFRDDFTTTVDTTNRYNVVKDSGASVAIVADASPGELAITSAETTDDDGGLLQSIQESFKLASGKRFALEVEVKCSDADQTDIFVGLSEQASTNPENILTASNRAGFQVNDGNASLLCKVEKADVESSKDSEQDLADDTYVRLGIGYDGERLQFEVARDGKAVFSADQLPTANMALALFSLSGSATGTRVSTFRNLVAVQEL